MTTYINCNLSYVKPSLGVASGGVSYGALTTQYETDVVAAGGTLSTAAKDAVESLLYDDYDDGASGTGNVASFISKLQFFWAPISDNFNGVLECIVGSLTNVGFVSGDYSQSVGVTGDGGSYMITNVELHDVPISNSSLGLSLEFTGLPGTEYFMARIGNSSEYLEIRSGTGNVQTRFRDSSSTIVFTAVGLETSGTLNDVIVYSGGGGGSRRMYRSTDVSGGIKTDFNTDFNASPGLNVGLFGRLTTSGTSVTGPYTGVMRSAFIGDQLTDVERNILIRALEQFDTDRSNL